MINIKDVPSNTSKIRYSISSNTYKLVEDLKGFDKVEICVDSPCRIVSDGFSFKCKRILFRSTHNIYIENILFNCSLVFRNCGKCFINNVSILEADNGSGGSIVITDSKVVIEKTIFRCPSMPALFIEDNSFAIARSIFCNGQQQSAIVISTNSKFEMYDSNICNIAKNGIYSSDNCDILIKRCAFKSISFPSLFVNESTCRIEESEIRDIQQNGITISKSYSFCIINCYFANIEASAVSVSSQSRGFIVSNTFHCIEGNSIYVNENSDLVIAHNFLQDSVFPGIAILQQCSAQIFHNDVGNVQKSGICSRGSINVSIDNNYLHNIAECGFSISDSCNTRIRNNRMTNIDLAAVESYNSSNAEFYYNDCDLRGKYGVMCYSGGSIKAKYNNFYNIELSLVSIRFKGKAKIAKNYVKNCPIQFCGNTIQNFLLYDNGDFVSETNSPELVQKYNSNLITCSEEVHEGLCIKCQIKPRECFLKGCGHKIYCMECGTKAFKNNELCDLCRFPIEGITPGFQSSADEKCMICLENTANSIIFPCGHMGFCSNCLSKWYNENENCPLCNLGPSSYKLIELNV